MIRIPNWDIALATWASEQLGRPFVWGEVDCGSLALGALAVMFGTSREDLLASVGVAPWDSKIGAARSIESSGGARSVLVELGAVPVGRYFLQSGDIVLSFEPEAPVQAGVIIHSSHLLGVSEGGVVLAVPLRDLRPEADLEGWRVLDGD